MSNNPSFVLRAVEDVAYEERPVPETVADTEVLVAIKKTGICGSDVHYLVHGRIGDFIVKDPMVLGHESAGVITKVGSKVKHVKVGDRVAVEPGSTCRVCDACKSGRYNLCPDIIFAATPPYDGTLTRYYRVLGDLTYPLPENLSLEDGAMMEPLSVGVHSVSNLGNFRFGQSIAVFGCGPVGLLCMAVAKALGAKRIIAADIVPSRLDFAKTYVGAIPYQPLSMNKDESRPDYSRRNAENMKKTLGIDDRGTNAIDLVIDASGAEVSIQTGLYVVGTGGIMVQVGMGNPNIQIDMAQLMTKEVALKGSFRYTQGDYPQAIALVSQGKIDLKPLVTHRYKFDEAIVAFQATRSGKSDDGKAVIKAIISGPDVSPQDL
ncbi:xylitol dehydrogenase [Rhodocollybia butyracea]|uniref:Xylitol dehydrogenase n=1 Tax=Rhodocollybia butyracea TaxID=206335 RepID=A0A9P5QAF2_9AGAR|nr:xylitol dehydrogenase [Rhodocollybia butyracea]